MTKKPTATDLAYSISPALHRGLRTLAVETQKGGGLVRTNAFGEAMWSDAKLKNGYRGSACSSPFSLPAGKMLRRLQELGLVQYAHPMPGVFGWELTYLGQSVVLIQRGREARGDAVQDADDRRRR